MRQSATEYANTLILRKQHARNKQYAHPGLVWDSFTKATLLSRGHNLAFKLCLNVWKVFMNKAYIGSVSPQTF